MPGDIRKVWRLFIASPGDVAHEREAVRRVAEHLNMSIGKQEGYEIESVQWETHVAPGAGRAQGIILDQIGRYDIFLGIMWRRFGTPTEVAESGTAEEFNCAYEAWQQNNDLPLMFYFCQRPFWPTNLADLDQLGKVLDFRGSVERKALVWQYVDVEEFAEKITKHLSMRLKRLMESNAAKGSLPEDDEINLLRQLWKRMSAEVREAMSIAYNEKRLLGDGGIATEDLFAALLRLNPPELDRVVSHLPKEALPEPTAGVVCDKPYVVEERPWLSHCVSSSLRRFAETLPKNDELGAVDLFVDIAKRGTGDSVARLRSHGIGPREVDAVVAKAGLSVHEPVRS